MTATVPTAITLKGRATPSGSSRFILELAHPAGQLVFKAVKEGSGFKLRICCSACLPTHSSTWNLSWAEGEVLINCSFCGMRSPVGLEQLAVPRLTPQLLLNIGPTLDLPTAHLLPLLVGTLLRDAGAAQGSVNYQISV